MFNAKNNRVQVYDLGFQSLAAGWRRQYIGRRLMSRIRLVAAASAVLFLAACGGGAAPARTLTARQALTQSPEWVEFEAPSSRQELFKELARASQSEAGQRASDPVLFPLLRDGDLVAAPGFDAKTDLLQAPDAGVFQLDFEGRTSEHWSQERRESLQGLSEREAAELIARSLLHLWKIEAAAGSPVQVDRVTGAPYAAAYVDGILRINPAFIYLAAAPATEK